MNVYLASIMLSVLPQISQISPTLSLFLNHTPTTEIYTLSLHDALPIFRNSAHPLDQDRGQLCQETQSRNQKTDRKSTRLNSSHRCISYAVFCLKKKKIKSNDRLTSNAIGNLVHSYEFTIDK